MIVHYNSIAIVRLVTRTHFHHRVIVGKGLTVSGATLYLYYIVLHYIILLRTSKSWRTQGSIGRTSPSRTPSILFVLFSQIVQGCQVQVNQR